MFHIIDNFSTITSSVVCFRLNRFPWLGFRCEWHLDALFWSEKENSTYFLFFEVLNTTFREQTSKPASKKASRSEQARKQLNN
jgi:hypothetical protein